VNTSVFVGVSQDGFIARPDGRLDWLQGSGSDTGGEGHGYEAFIATVDVLVIGRNTFDTVLAFPEWPYGDKPVVVLSTRPLPAAPPGAVVERMSGEPAEIVAALAGRGFRHAYVDGGITIQRFLRAGLIQRLVISRLPVLIGRGIPLFGDLPDDVPLGHVRTKQYVGGMVQSEYVVLRRRTPDAPP
jgi:dihydrofolate reductase